MFEVHRAVLTEAGRGQCSRYTRRYSLSLGGVGVRGSRPGGGDECGSAALVLDGRASDDVGDESSPTGRLRAALRSR